MKYISEMRNDVLNIREKNVSYKNIYIYNLYFQISIF